jgi:hypothetical protein
MKRAIVSILITLLMTATLSVTAAAESQVSKKPIKPETDGTFLLTVFLRHDQSMTLAQIKAHQEETGFLKMFPPEGVEVVSWHVAMGIGQVITLRVPPHKLRAVNLAVEKGAWGAFRSEYYPTYDLWPIIQHKKRELADK